MKTSTKIFGTLLFSLFLFGCENPTDTQKKDDSQIDDKNESFLLYVMNADVFIMDAETSQETKLTESTDIDTYRNPMIDTINKKIVYIKDHDKEFTNILIMNFDGTNKIDLTQTTTVGDWYGYPSISPDGSKILYCFSDNTTNGIYTMDIDGTNKTCIIDSDINSYLNPLFSPDMNKIVFSTYDSDKEFIDIAILNSDGTGLTKITSSTIGSLYNFSGISPDGNKIVYTRGDDPGLYCMDISGSNEIKLVSQSNTDLSYLNPKYSHSGEYIICIEMYQKLYSNILLMNSDGSNIQNVTGNTTSGILYKDSSLID